MTNYVILRKQDACWQEYTAQYARDARTAIRNVTQATGEHGTFIAVPARSWRKVEQ